MANTQTPLHSAFTETTSSQEPRIYVACLAAYNAGRLHGRWISAAKGEAHIWHETRAMLADSPEPGPEEHAIHDYENFQGAAISEYASFESVCELAGFIQAHGILAAKLYVHFGEDIQQSRAALDDHAGEYSGLAEFAECLTRDTGPDIPAALEPYIDWQAMGRDMELSGDIFTITLGFDRLHVFWNR